MTEYIQINIITILSNIAYTKLELDKLYKCTYNILMTNESKKRVGGYVSEDRYKELQQILMRDDKSFTQWLEEKIFWELGSYCLYTAKDFKEMMEYYDLDKIVAENVEPWIIYDTEESASKQEVSRFYVNKRTFYLIDDKIVENQFEDDVLSEPNYIDWSGYDGKYQVNIRQLPETTEAYV